MRIQLAKETRQSPVENKVQWPGVLVFEKIPEGIMISEYARIRILTMRVRRKSSRVGQIWSQIGKVFSEIRIVPWRISMATIRRGAPICARAFPGWKRRHRIKAGYARPVVLPALALVSVPTPGEYCAI